MHVSNQKSMQSFPIRADSRFGLIHFMRWAIGLVVLTCIVIPSSSYKIDENFVAVPSSDDTREQIRSTTDSNVDILAASQMDRISFHLIHVSKWFVLYQSLRVIATRWYDRLSRRPKDLMASACRIIQQENRTTTPEINSTTTIKKAERLSLVLKALNIIGDGHTQSITQVVTILEQFHKKHGVVDLFAEYNLRDIVASTVVLSALQQRCKIIAADCATARSSSHPFGSESIDDAMLEDLAYYAVYASAAYGWKLEFAMRGKMHSTDDTKALTRRTNVQHRDILVAKWASTPRRPAYFLARDSDRRTLVLSIRGTFSIDDLLTDLCCTTAEMNSKPNPSKSPSSAAGDVTLPNRFLSLFGYRTSMMQSECSVHCGMLQAAVSLRDELADILHAELKTFQGSSLVLVGHSMAGGVAALLGGLLSKDYPDLKVFAYGPAPCVSIPSTPRYSNDPPPQIFSVIRENDPFRALSLQHVADLSFMLGKLCGDQPLRDSIMARLLTTKRSRTTDAWLVSTRNSLRPPSSRDKLYPPGRLCLLSRVRRRRSGMFNLLPLRRRWLAIAEVERSFFEDLEIPSVTHFSVHAPTSYEESLRQLVKCRQRKRPRR